MPHRDSLTILRENEIESNILFSESVSMSDAFTSNKLVGFGKGLLTDGHNSRECIVVVNMGSSPKVFASRHLKETRRLTIVPSSECALHSRSVVLPELFIQSQLHAAYDVGWHHTSHLGIDEL